MTTTINASPSNGLVQSADGSGILKVQSNGKTTNALAWVNFNGVSSAVIRSSYNVSSVTRNSTGDYTVNMTTALTDADYASVISVSAAYSASTVFGMIDTNAGGLIEAAPTTSAFRFSVANSGGTYFDVKYASVAIFGN